MRCADVHCTSRIVALIVIDVRDACTQSGTITRRPAAGLARDGSRLFTHQFPERYFLAGATRTMQFDIAPEVCGQLAAIEASVVAERLDLKRKLDVDPGVCK